VQVHTGDSPPVIATKESPMRGFWGNSCPEAKSIPHVALHAFSATNLGAPELYNSSQTAANMYIGPVTAFSTPTIFNGQVYIGTRTEVDVFGLCASYQGGCKK
jgi:hypothetical protein